MDLLPRLLALILSPLLLTGTGSLPAQQLPSPAPEPSAEAAQRPAPAHPVYDQGADKLYILMFHDVVPDGKEVSNWSVTESQLRDYLQWMQDHGYTTVLPSQLAGGEALPERAVLLTFDDGYASNYTLAYPLLQEFHAKAVISLIGHYLDEENPGFLSWEMCREMAASGLVEFGSHTYDAHVLDRCLRRLSEETQGEYQARIFPDVDKSIALLERELGAPICFFAYPNGRADKWSDDFLAQRFAITVTTNAGVARLSRGLYRLPRFNINTVQPVWAVLPK